MTYWSLSFRRRLLRDLYLFPFAVPLMIWGILKGPSAWVFMLLLPFALGSTLYNYFQWQNLER